MSFPFVLPNSTEKRHGLFSVEFLHVVPKHFNGVIGSMGKHRSELTHEQLCFILVCKYEVVSIDTCLLVLSLGVLLWFH